MNLKRLIALGFLGMTLGMGQAYGISVNIPGADATMSVDEYQNYRKNTAESRRMEQKIVERVTKADEAIPNYDMSRLPADIYHNTELNHGIKYSSTVFILKDHGADIKFTVPEASIVGHTDESSGKHKEITRSGGILSYDGEWSYELRPQPKSENWEDTNIAYNKLNSECMKDVFYKKRNPISNEDKRSIKVLGANPFTYTTVNKATWDVFEYKNNRIVGTINFTMPKQPTISYHLGYIPSKSVSKKLSAQGEDTVVQTIMAPLANIVLPSVKPASDILEYTSEVHRGPFTFRTLKNSKSKGTKITKTGKQIEYFQSGKIKESISVGPLHKRDDVKAQNLLYNSLMDFVGVDSLNEGKPIQYATVWNDGLPGIYFEVKGEKDTIFIMTVFDDTHRYSHYILKPHDVHVSNFKLRDIVQYVDYKQNKENYSKYKAGLGMPSYLLEEKLLEKIANKK